MNLGNTVEPRLCLHLLTLIFTLHEMSWYRLLILDLLVSFPMQPYWCSLKIANSLRRKRSLVYPPLRLA